MGYILRVSTLARQGAAHSLKVNWPIVLAILAILIAIPGIYFGLAASRGWWPFPPSSPTSPNVAPRPIEFGSSVQELRTKQQVRELTELESGSNILKIPNGAYGFMHPFNDLTIATGLERTSLRRLSDGLDIWEVHKTQDSRISLLGFVSEQDRLRLLGPQRKEPIEILFFAQSYREFNNVLTIPSERIKKLDARRLNGGPLVIDMTVN